MRILVDCDGVIFDIQSLWVKKYRDEVGKSNFTKLDDIRYWDFLPNVIGDSFADEYITPEIVRNAPLESDMSKAIERIMDIHEVIFVTDIKGQRSSLIRAQRLMGIFSVFVESIRFVGMERTKMDADVLIDDNIRAVLEFAKRDGKVSLLVSRPWNVDFEIPENVIRVWTPHDLLNVVEVLNARKV